jgi:hypothetical protein
MSQYEQSFNQIALDVKSGDAILFAGSGFSRDCDSAKFKKKLPTAPQLKQMLGKELSIETESNSLEDVSEFYAKTRGDPNLFSILQDWFTVDSVPLGQVQFVGLNWSRIYTTNFDNILEQCIATAKAQPITMDIDRDPSKPIPKHAILHLNGAIATATSANFRRKIRLTASTYWDNRIAESGWLDRFQRDLTHCRSIIFVGYSLFDIDIAKLLRANPKLRKKTFFIEAPGVDQITKGKLEEFGEVIPVGYGVFADRLLHDEFLQTDQPRPFYTCFEQIEPPAIIKGVSADDARKFFVFGNHAIDVAFLEPSVRAGYAIDRDCHATVLDQIRHGQSHFVLHSTIGNGKSVSLLLLASGLKGEGYNIFSYLGRSERLMRELNQIKAQKSVIMFEDAFGRLEDLRYIKENVSPSIPIIATCRTAAFELRQNDLQSALSPDFARHSLNQLKLHEREQLAKCLLGLGFFGRYSGRQQRLPSLMLEWGNDTRSTVLKLFEDSEIGGRLKTSIEAAIETDPQVRDVLVVMFLLAVAEVRSDIDTCDALLELSSYPLVHKYTDLFRDFFDVLPDRILIRSSVVAEYCLQNVFQDSQIIDVLISIGNNQRGKANVDEALWQILRQFMRYGFVEPLLTSSKKRNLLLRYFEAMRDNSFYSRRPHFWLQYAIAEMAVGHYPMAKTYLDTARSYGEKIPNYGFTFIDNHTARYLLESRSRSVADSPDFYVSFLKASHILSTELRTSGQANYTARVAK